MTPRRILLAEDEDGIALALEHLIAREGHAVARVSDGPTALAALEETPPDLVILDVMLPGRTGYDICQAIRRNPDLGDVRVLMMTARGGEVERRKGLALGADAFLTKPFAIADLMAQIRALLGGRGECMSGSG